MSKKILQNICLLILLSQSVFSSCVQGTDPLCMECDYLMEKCVFCSQGFIIPSRNRCSPIQSKVDHCIRYADETVCTLCNLGFYLNIENNTCLQYNKVTKFILSFELYYIPIFEY